jgi:hypothetical protein
MLWATDLALDVANAVKLGFRYLRGKMTSSDILPTSVQRNEKWCENIKAIWVAEDAFSAHISLRPQNSCVLIVR